MSEHRQNDATLYYEKEGLNAYFTPCSVPDSEMYTAHEVIAPGNRVPFVPELQDLVRLHKFIRQRKVLTIMEFGTGYSTIVMADALAKNKADYEKDFRARDIRCLNPFMLFSVDADEYWIQESQRRLPEHLSEFISFQYSTVYMGTFNDRVCHYYAQLPNIMPDFIYLDGPTGLQVSGMIDGSDFHNNYERTVISADLLRLEPTFTPGTMILVDGRVNNARFLKNNFQRRWEINEDHEADITTFELLEAPLGIHNKKRLEFQNLLR